jgi:DnaJ domain
MTKPQQRYPLTWPAGWKRTPLWQRSHSPFKIESTARAFRDLMDELGRLGATNVIISSNLKLRADGYPYSQQPRTDDEGIAIYFTRKGKDMVLACDKFARREANMRAITKTIDAIRGIERWGSSDMMERAFTGFAQLEAPPDLRQWWEVLGVPEDAHSSNVEAAYRRLRSESHPDKGGNDADFQAVQKAYEQFKRAGHE